MINLDSPFVRFWDGLNAHLRLSGLPEITFGPAHRIWLSAVGEAGREARASLYGECVAG